MRKVLYKILLFINALIALSLLLSYMAVHINPISFALPALFGLAYPYILVLNILMVIIWAMLLRYEAFISVVIIAIGFNHFSNYIRLTKPTNDKEGTFRVLSYNIHLFTSFESNRSGSEKKILETLKSNKPDILCLQEVYFKGSVAEKEISYRKILGEKYYSHLKVLGSGKNRYYGIATFSRFPIVRKGEIVHSGSSSLSIFTDILINNDTFRIYNNHLQSFRLKNMEKSFLIEFSSEDNETMNEVKYLSMSLKNGFIRRSLQAKVVKNHINNSPYPVIVAGDFNDTPVSYTYRKIRKGLQDSFVNSGYGAGFTYRGKYPPNRIDYILYDKALDNSFFETIKLKYSDHYPIIAYFRKKV